MFQDVQSYVAFREEMLKSKGPKVPATPNTQKDNMGHLCVWKTCRIPDLWSVHTLINRDHVVDHHQSQVHEHEPQPSAARPGHLWQINFAPRRLSTAVPLPMCRP